MNTELNLLPSSPINYEEYYSKLASIAKSMIYFKEFEKFEKFFQIQSSFSRTGFFARDAFIENFSWAVPSVQAIEEICKFAAGELILEVGAGNCFWAFLIRKAGQRIIPSDSFASHGTKRSKSFVPEMFELDAIQAIQVHQTNVLLLSWPGYEDPMGVDALKAFTGNKLIYIGEGPGGCTGNDEFFDLLDLHWIRVNRVDIPCWYGIHDSLEFYVRK